MAATEITAPPPSRLRNCGHRWNEWAAAAKTDPTDYEAMRSRIDARGAVERCNQSWRLDHLSRNAKLRRGARGEIVAASLLLAIGGSGLTAAGGVGIAWMPTSSNSDPVGVMFPAIGAAFSAAIAVVGAALLGVGAHYSHLAISRDP